jgi:cystathionine gamma-synthase
MYLMITFDPIDRKTESYAILNNLKVFTVVVSLGGVESLAENLWVYTHSDVAQEDKRKSGFCPQTVRLSFVLEEPNDLCLGFDQALSKI